jgi:UDP-glucose 4-epimerase
VDKKAMSKIILTGNAGFLGSHLQDALIERGDDVVGIDSFVGGFKRNINPETKMYVHDLCDSEAVDSTFKLNTPEVVYHIAADATEGRSQFTPISATKNNLLASVNVFTSAIKYGAKRIIFTSSMSVYGEQEPPFDETMPTSPVDVYGINKDAAEKILKVLCEVHGVEYVIIRPHNVFGPRQNIRDAYRNVVGIFMNRVMNGQEPIIYGDGEQVRSFTYIDNITPCFVRAADAPISGETINVGPIETQTVNHLANKILNEFDSNLIPTHQPDRPREVKYAHCTNKKAMDLLGYETLVHFDEGIKKMAVWAKELGHQEPVYLDSLELVKNAPRAWTERMQ